MYDFYNILFFTSLFLHLFWDSLLRSPFRMELDLLKVTVRERHWFAGWTQLAIVLDLTEN